VIDGVRAGAISPDSGRAMLSRHPGYKPSDRSGSRLRVIHHCRRLIVPGVRRDTVPLPPRNRAWLYSYVCDHLDSVQAHRGELEEFTTALAADRAEQARIAAALDSALAYLVPVARELEMPTIYGMFFEPGGFGGRSIAADLLRHLQRKDSERIAFFAHELHHALMSRLPSDVPASVAQSTSPVPWWLGRLQWEGIASLIDKRDFVRRSGSGPERRHRPRQPTRRCGVRSRLPSLTAVTRSVSTWRSPSRSSAGARRSFRRPRARSRSFARISRPRVRRGVSRGRSRLRQNDGFSMPSRRRAGPSEPAAVERPATLPPLEA
jgi:Putative zinc dependent peptidase (DUF5700)